ncbi:amidohydrolase family protein [Bosea sp. AK1]|uniref:metal-dependent hydrolase family protein n=1 Tax=Bosea sp. AK1 TaxID=2587160 RepID=UPI001639DEDE|nr:amidohydrolase family protein [Bosea sp. AK1]
MTITIFSNAAVFDGESSELQNGLHVVVEGQRIREVSNRKGRFEDAVEIDCGRRTLMPGLIDAHVHVLATNVNLAPLDRLPKSYLFAQARFIIEDMLQRGFTTVRDAGGADAGFARAVEEGFLDGPRMLISGNALSQTGGHCDLRSRIPMPFQKSWMTTSSILGRIVDGVPAVREAARDELRMGAHHIKIMASGGAASPTDPIANTQFSVEELEAIVEEAEAWQTYVMAHAYTPKAISRAIKAGVRTIEHGNLIDDETAVLMRERGAYLIPTLITSDSLVRFGDELGSPEESMRKIRSIRDKGLEAIQIAARNNLKMGFGTDILGTELHPLQCEEFQLRAKVEKPVDTLRSATSVNAEALMQKGEIGVIAEGAFADILLVDKNPLVDANTFDSKGSAIAFIMKGGKVFKNRL